MELLIYLAILSIVVSIVIPMLFAAAENRLLQQTVSIVEHNGAQVLQNVTVRIRQGQRIISPAMGQTGAYLVLQTGSGGLNPTIIGTATGVVVVIEGAIEEAVSATQVAVDHFVVRNTSVSASRPSVKISFNVIRTIRLQQPHTYTRAFETAVSLFPTDRPYVDACSCSAPTCGTNMITWEICQNALCYAASNPLKCQ